MSQRHVAGSGARAGQWVTCNAKGTCKLGGSHISERDFYATRAWIQEKTGKNTTNSSITADDVKRFQKTTEGDAEGYKEWQKKAELLAVKEKGLSKILDAQVFAGEENLVERVPAEAKKFVPYGANSIPVTKGPEAKSYIDTGDVAGLKKLKREGKYTDTVAQEIRVLRVDNIRASNMEDVKFTSKTTGKVLSTYDIPEVKKYMETGDRKNLYAANHEYDITLYGTRKIADKRLEMLEKEAPGRPAFAGDSDEQLLFELASHTPEAKDYFENGNAASFEKLQKSRKVTTFSNTIREMEKVRDYRMSHNPLKEVRFTDPETNKSASTFDIPEVKEYMATGKNTTLVSMQKKYGMSKVFAARLKNHRAETLGEKPAPERPERPAKPAATAATKPTRPTRPGKLRNVFRKASEFLGNDIKA